jgi:hypothetical protein
LAKFCRTSATLLNQGEGLISLDDQNYKLY